MELSEKFKQFEQNYDLGKFYFNDVWIYPLIKMAVFQALFKQGKMLEIKAKSKSQIALEILKALYWQKLKSHVLNKPDIFYIVDGITRRLDMQGHFVNIYVSPIINHLKMYHHLILEFPDETLAHYPSIPEKYRLFPDVSFKWILFKTRFINKEWIAENVVNEINSFFGTTFNAKFINTRIDKFFAFEKYFVHLLGKILPKLIFVVNAYDYKKMALVSAAKKLNIKTVELQHGIIYDSHLAYFYYQVLKRDLLPDFLFTYGDFFSKLILSKSKAFIPENVVAVGFPYLEKMAKEPPLVPDRIKELQKNKKIILITSQWVIRDQLKTVIKKISQNLPEDFHIVYKTHPGETNIKESYRELKANNVTLVTEKHISSFELMKIAKIHSTVFSTSLFESFKFGLPNILIEIPGYSKNVLNFVNNRSVFMASSAEDFLKKLTSIEAKYEYHQRKVKEICAQFFKSNALENLKKITDELLVTR